MTTSHACDTKSVNSITDSNQSDILKLIFGTCLPYYISYKFTRGNTSQFEFSGVLSLTGLSNNNNAESFLSLECITILHPAWGRKKQNVVFYCWKIICAPVHVQSTVAGDRYSYLQIRYADIHADISADIYLHNFVHIGTSADIASICRYGTLSADTALYLQIWYVLQIS